MINMINKNSSSLSSTNNDKVIKLHLTIQTQSRRSTQGYLWLRIRYIIFFQSSDMVSEFGRTCTWRLRLRLLYIEKVILFDVPVFSKTNDVVYRKLFHLICLYFLKRKVVETKNENNKIKIISLIKIIFFVYKLICKLKKKRISN